MEQSTINLLYSVYNFPNIILAMLGGVFVDRLGLRTGCFVFCTIILVGQTIVALGASTKNFYIMLVGRLCFAVGGESLAVAQSSFVSKWWVACRRKMSMNLFAMPGSRERSWRWRWVWHSLWDVWAVGLIFSVQLQSPLLSDPVVNNFPLALSQLRSLSLVYCVTFRSFNCYVVRGHTVRYF